MKNTRWMIPALLLSTCLWVSCSGDQQQLEEGYDQQGEYDEEGNYDEQGNYTEQGDISEEGNYSDQGGYANDATYGGNVTGEDASNFSGNAYGGATQGEGEYALSNSYQQPMEGEGEALNNSTGDAYAYDAAAQPAVDQTMTADMGAAEPAAPTYIPGEIPEGWARTQNGLFINLSNLSDMPIGYDEMTPMWQ